MHKLPTANNDGDIELTILMPCLNEEETIAACVRKANGFLSTEAISGEVLIADNGSTDNSKAIAISLGARVVDVKDRGYGAALLGGIEAARGRFIIMGDADDSYDFCNLGGFVEQLRDGKELVIGNRFLGGISKGAMPPLHRYLGNPVLSFVGRLLYKAPVGDFHCGLRGFDRKAIQQLDLHATGMEFASEMVIKAVHNNLSIVEIPTTLRPDGRHRPPHLRSWRDGWRHLRLLLLFSPDWLFVVPGLSLFGAGLFGSVLLLSGPITIGSLSFDFHTLIFCGTALVLGFQILTFSIIAKVYGYWYELLPKSRILEVFLSLFTVERGIALGLGAIIIGLAGSFVALNLWSGRDLTLEEIPTMMRIVVTAVTVMALGVQTFFGSFLLGVLMAKHR